MLSVSDSAPAPPPPPPTPPRVFDCLIAPLAPPAPAPITFAMLVADQSAGRVVCWTFPVVVRMTGEVTRLSRWDHRHDRRARRETDLRNAGLSALRRVVEDIASIHQVPPLGR